MTPSSRIYIAGHRGLVGSAIVRRLRAAGHDGNLLLRTHAELDLTDEHPALIRKFHEAKQHGDATVTVWGSGTPRREFLYSGCRARDGLRRVQGQQSVAASSAG